MIPTLSAAAKKAEMPGTTDESENEPVPPKKRISTVVFADNDVELQHHDETSSGAGDQDDDDDHQYADDDDDVSSDGVSGNGLVPYSADLEQGLPERSERSSSISSALRPPSTSSAKLSRRFSNVRDMETGIENGARAQHAVLRHHDSVYPRSPSMRRRKNLLKFFGVGDESLGQRLPAPWSEDDTHSSKHGRYMVSSRHLVPGSSGRSTSQPRVEQYRLQAVRPKTDSNACLKWIGMGDTKFTIYEGTELNPSCSCFGYDPNQIVIRFFQWIFRQNLCMVALTAAAGCFIITMSFGLLIWAEGVHRPYCIAGTEFNVVTFIDAYALSWTTFATVGYGAVSAAVSTNEDVINIHRCTGFTILVSFEAFVGLVFASFWGAIIFIRVSRIQSFAQVTFSETVVLRYGSGVTALDEYDHGSEGGSMNETGIPCPILEFRVVNRMHNVYGGEIIDATMSVVAAIDTKQACPTEQEATTRRRLGNRKGKGKKGHARQVGRTRREKASRDSSSSVLSDARISSVGSVGSLPILKADAHRQTQELEEDPSGYLVPKKIICKLECEGQEHPFFKRVWTLRHTLDERSPLLRQHARAMVKLNNGFWPADLNTAEGVRAAFCFDQLLVSLSGTSNADANSVYAQHMYDIADTSVGYRFVNMLYHDPDDNSLRVDLALLSDVMEQAGGGGEDLSSAPRRGRFDEILVL